MGAVRRRRGYRRRRGPREEAGFGLLEVVIASGVMLSALTSMAYVATNSFYDIAAAKQRQTAVALADEAMEEVRALPYATVWLGLRTSDVAGDPRIIGAGTAGSPYRLATTNERIIHAASNQTVAPIVPNVSSRTVDQTVYAVRTYLSYFDDDPTLGVVTVTAYVDWRSAGLGHRATFLRSTTALFSPLGCPWATAQPFAGRCPAVMTGAASIAPGQIRVTGSGTAGAAAVGISNDVPAARTSMTLGQIASIGGAAVGGGISSAGTRIGFPKSASRADDNPATVGVGLYQRDADTGLPPSGTSLAGLGSISVSGTSVDTSESASAVAADASNECLDPSGTTQTDGLACARSVGEQVGVLRTTYDLAGIGLGTIALSEVAAPPAASVAYTKHLTAADSSGRCTGTSSVGCVHASASRSIGRLRIGALPSLGPIPLGFGGYVFQLDGYTDTVTAEAGIGAAAPTAVASGTFSYWNGLGYTSLALTSSSAFNITTPNVGANIGLYSVTVSSSVKKGASSTPASPVTTCLGSLACRTSSEATIGAPLIATVTYSFRLLGVTVYQLAMTIDLGDLQAKATYTDPP